MKFLKLRNVVLFILATIVPLFLWNRLQGVDNLYMYAHAEDMLQNGFYRTTDIFSMHENFAFLYQKWAACILTYVIVRGFGWQGLTVATYVLIFLLFCALYVFGLQFNSQYKMLNVLIIMTSAYLLEANGTLRFRPHMFAGLLFIYLFSVIEDYERYRLEPDVWFYMRFVVTSVILMWFHSTMWIMFVIVFLPYLMHFSVFYYVSRRFSQPVRSKKPLLIAMILMFCAGILNPNGYKEYGYMLTCMKATGDKYSHVDELQRMPFSAYLIFTSVVLLALFWVGYRLYREDARIYVPCMYLVLGSLIMPLLSWRLVFYSVIFMAIALMLQMKFMIHLTYDLKPFALPASICLMTVVILLVGVLSRLFLASSSNEALACGTKIQVIIDAGDLVADISPEAKIFNTTAHVGSYGIYKHLKPYMDCRAEVYDDAINQKQDILSEIHDLSANQYNGIALDAGGIELLDEAYHPDYYVLTRYSDADRNIKKALDKLHKTCLFDESGVWVYEY